jgi:hypothetical protein
MKVTLKRFLEICNKGFIETYIASLYVAEYDVRFAEWSFDCKIKCIKSLEELEPYMDYEITDFSQIVAYGEIQEQNIYVRPMQ